MCEKVLALMLMFALSMPASAADWLLGKWYIDGDTSNEGLEFIDHERVEAIGLSGKRTPGNYQMDGDDGVMTLSITREISMQVNIRAEEGQGAIVIYSEGTDVSATYRKVASE